MTQRIAMWSGPRNISTAMLRSFENRSDTTVVDEPLYAYYLAATGVEHPGWQEIITMGDTDWRSVVAKLVGPVPGDPAVFYQKHMCHHLLDAMDWDWLDALQHVFLIRDPAAVVRSYIRERPLLNAEEVGIPQQHSLFADVCQRSSQIPPVIDAERFLADPRGQLQRLCQRLGIPFQEAMLQWPAGPRDTDGIWAKHWYAQVWQSTGFASPRPADGPPLEPALQALVADCQPLYQQLLQHAL